VETLKDAARSADRCGRVVWHGDSRTLTVGEQTHVVPDVDGDNDELLRCYLALVREVRGLVSSERFALRQDDVEALASILDLDDADLELRLVRMLHVSSTEAAELRRKMVARRILGAAGALTVGLLASMPLTAAASEAPAPTTTTTAAVAGATISVATSVVNIGEPLVIERDVTPPPPPEETPAPPPEETPAPPADDNVDIGEPLVIERDPSDVPPPTTTPPPVDEHVEIGDALVIERDAPPAP
jgi:hypothetical protein